MQNSHTFQQDRAIHIFVVSMKTTGVISLDIWNMTLDNGPHCEVKNNGLHCGVENDMCYDLAGPVGGHEH